jgi:hypothetical protein
MKASKLELFNLYVSNFKAIRSKTKISPTPPEEDLFVCPMCFRYFTRTEIESKNNRLRIEHVPPKSLGGKPITLTCFECNSWAGRELESSLNNYFDLVEFNQAIPQSSVDATIAYQNGPKFNANLVWDSNHHLRMETSEERSNPVEISKLQASKGTTPQSMKIHFAGKRARYLKIGRAECAMLRIAYLLGFSQFGYAFILPSPISIIRNQIFHPEKFMLSHWGIFPADNLSDSFLGVNLISYPKELKSFGVVFDLFSKLKKYRYLVLLPGPEDGSEKIYKNLLNVKFAKGFEYQIHPLPKTKELFSQPDLAFTVHWIWNNFVKT